jgi:hypothetical protein
MRNLIHASLAAVVLAFSSLPSQAGGLNFSANWATPSTVNMSKKVATNVVSKCNNVSTYTNLKGNTSYATVVAGPHTTPTDNKLHLTVRLYKNNNHEKSCHVYTGKNNAYASCDCVYTD